MKKAFWIISLLGGLLTGVAYGVIRPQYGGELRISLVDRVYSLDPGRIHTFAELSLIRCLFDRLVEVDNKGRLKPVLLKSLPQRIGRGLWRLKMKPALFFHDGRRLMARDVAASLNRLSRSLLGSIEKVSVQKSDELTIQCSKSCPELARFLTSTALSIIPGTGFSLSNPIGSGPFKLGKVERSRFELLPNLSHVMGRPFLNRLVFITAVETSWQETAMMNGKIDVAYNLPSRAGPFRILESPFIDGVILVANRKRPPLNKDRVYTALRYGIDRESLVRRTARLPAKAATGYNRKRARHLLTGRKYRIMTILVNKDRPDMVAMARMIQYKLFNIGLSTQVKQSSARRFFNHFARGRFDIALTSSLPLLEGATVSLAGGAPAVIELFSTIRRVLYRKALRGVIFPGDAVIPFADLWIKKP